MAGRQRILVVSTAADEPDLRRVRAELRRGPLVLAAATPDAERVVRALAVEARTEALLAPVRFPEPDRGHQVDALVRRHALSDRFRDVVVVTDAATATLLLRVLAPGQLAAGGPVTVVGLVRGDRPVVVRRALGVGLLLGLAAALSGTGPRTFLLPGAAAALGLALLLVPPWRHLGRELLLAAAVGVAALFLLVAGSARFPASW